MYARYMTTNENPQNPHLSPLMASILTANAKWSNDLSDRVLDNKDREIAEWKERFLQLWDDMDKENRSVDSLRIQVVLNDYAYHAGVAARDLDTK
jgi:hypothetical protein